MKELVQAIDLALAGRWDESHRIVQKIEGKSACWIHAVLHKIEGDEGNSKYWYARAGKMERFPDDATAELQLIRGHLTGDESK